MYDTLSLNTFDDIILDDYRLQIWGKSEDTAYTFRNRGAIPLFFPLSNLITNILPIM
jgi:hypothetical protein